MTLVTRSKVISLYRQLLRYSENLQFTDKNYFCERIRCEYEKNKKLTDTEIIMKQIARGEELIKRDRFR